MTLAKQFQKELPIVLQQHLGSHGSYSIKKVSRTDEIVPVEERLSPDRGSEELVKELIQTYWVETAARVLREPNGSGTFPDWGVLFKDDSMCTLEVKNTYKDTIGQSRVSFGTLVEFDKSLRRAGNSYRSKYFDATYICFTGRTESPDSDYWCWAGVDVGKLYELSHGGVFGKQGAKRLRPSVQAAGSRRAFLDYIEPAIRKQALFLSERKA